MGWSGISSQIAGDYLEMAMRDGIDFGLLDRLRVSVATKEGVPEALIVFTDHPGSPECRQARAAALSWCVPVMVFPATFCGC